MSKGGIIGRFTDPTRVSAKGVWNLREQFNYESDNFWPSRDIYAIYNGFDYQDGASSPSTWSNAPIGEADTNRRVVVLLYQRQANSGSNTASAVTIGGISASLIVSRNNISRGHVDIWSAIVPTGTTASIVVTWIQGGGDGKLVASYSLYGTSSTIYNTNTNKNGSGLTVSTTVDVIAGGFVLAMCGADLENGLITFTQGVDVSNEGKNTDGSDFRGAVSWGFKYITDTTSGWQIDATTNAGGDFLIAAASFQPAT
jgi:hypothetical protein